MRNLLSSLFAGSNNVRSTSSMKENASMIRSSHTPRRGFGLRSLVAAVAVVCSLAAGQQARAADIYVLTNNDGTNSSGGNFGRINTTSGAYTSISSISQSLTGLTWRNTNQQFYVTDNTIGAFGAPLRTLTTSGTLSSSLGNTTGAYGLAWRAADDQLYGMDFDYPAKTFKINPTTAALTNLKSSPGMESGGSPGGRYSIMNDVLYLTWSPYSGGGRFGTIGYTATSTYSGISTDSLYSNMGLANDGTTMYGIFGNGTAGQQQLYTIDVATGGLTAGPMITGTGLGTYFHGAAIVPVPEPSTYALGAIATGVMAAVARRRKARKA